jgi:septal ring factor EnvC (AmiA/AmiB activator)
MTDTILELAKWVFGGVVAGAIAAVTFSFKAGARNVAIASAADVTALASRVLVLEGVIPTLVTTTKCNDSHREVDDETAAANQEIAVIKSEFTGMKDTLSKLEQMLAQVQSDLSVVLTKDAEARARAAKRRWK